MTEKPFRVIVIGAGVAGLSLSHALQLANIDHVVLEKNKEPISLAGAVLSLYPNTARVFDQFGILDKVNKISRPLAKEYTRWPDGTPTSLGHLLMDLGILFDQSVIVTARQELIRQLYINLPDKSRVSTSRRVTKIQQNDSGVRIFLQDGSVEEGDIVVGADGVHSIVRQHIWEHADRETPGRISQKEREKMASDYGAFFGISKMNNAQLHDSSHSELHNIYGKDQAVVVFTEGDRVFWTISFKDEAKRARSSKRFNDEDVEKLAVKFNGMPITESLTFNDLWATRTRVGAVQLEEGVLNHWYSGRAVLAGDSVHKMTSDIGLGANSAVESIVTLANALYEFLKEDRTVHPTTSQLTKIFDEFQNKRIEKAKFVVALSGRVTRIHSYATKRDEYIVHHVLPKSMPKTVSNFVGIINSSPKLSYVKTSMTNEAAKGWTMPTREMKPQSKL